MKKVELENYSNGLELTISYLRKQLIKINEVYGVPNCVREEIAITLAVTKYLDRTEDNKESPFEAYIRLRGDK